MRTSTFAILLFLPALAVSQVQDPPQWNTSSSFVGGGLTRASDGNYYRCLKTNTNHNPIQDNHSYWELYYVRASVTLAVAASGARFNSLKTAWAMASSATITSPNAVTILISTSKASYQENFSTPFSLNATSGNQIFIHGDNAAKITLSFQTSDGFQLTANHALGALTGMTIQGANGISNYGMNVNQHCDVADFSGNTLIDFAIGISVIEHSSAFAANDIISGCSENGIRCASGSNVNASGTSVYGGAGHTGNCFEADMGSTVDASAAYASAMDDGFVSMNNSTINATGSTATGCTSDGFLAARFGYIDADISTSQSNGAYGFHCSQGGRIIAGNATVSGNGTSSFNPAPNAMDTLGNLITH